MYSSLSGISGLLRLDSEEDELGPDYPDDDDGDEEGDADDDDDEEDE